MEFINIPTQSEIDEMKLRLALIDRIYKTMIGIYIVSELKLPIPSGHGRLNFSLQKKQKAEIS